MGYIKEPVGIDFIVDPTPLTSIDKQKISEVIAYYKKTGKKKIATIKNSKPRTSPISKTKELA